MADPGDKMATAKYQVERASAHDPQASCRLALRRAVCLRYPFSREKKRMQPRSRQPDPYADRRGAGRKNSVPVGQGSGANMRLLPHGGKALAAFHAVTARRSPAKKHLKHPEVGAVFYPAQPARRDQTGPTTCRTWSPLTSAGPALTIRTIKKTENDREHPESSEPESPTSRRCTHAGCNEEATRDAPKDHPPMDEAFKGQATVHQRNLRFRQDGCTAERERIRSQSP
jgi:hypothetical protein